MKKVLFMSWLLALCMIASAACAEEPLMWLQQEEKVLHVSEALETDPIVYSAPLLYKLAETDITLPDDLEGMLSQLYPDIVTSKENKHVLLMSSHEYFRGEYWLRDPLPLLAADTVVGGQVVTRRLQELLRRIGWDSPSEPDIFCTVRQAVEWNQSPDTMGSFYAGNIPEKMWDEIYYLHFKQTFGGYPLEPWIQNANEAEYETRDASFAVDREGRIVAAYLFPGYGVVSQSAEDGELLTAREAGESLIRFMQYCYEVHDEAYIYRWEINSFTEGLILTHNGTAYPAWHIDYDQIMIDRITGEEWHSRKEFTVNAMTGL